ncbi:MAG: DUF1016 N-terminal domain-containing protein [Gammaproteobacteria bacterium]
MKAETTFVQLVGSIQSVHRELAAQASKAVNISLTLRNWLIGFYIEEYERNGIDRTDYGDKLMDCLSQQLSAYGISRCDRRELYRYRHFYLVYPQVVQSLPAPFRHLSKIANSGVADSRILELSTPLSAIDAAILISKLSFTHIVELIALDDATKRAFYEVECIRGNWSVRELKRQIDSLYYERSGLSLDKRKLAELAQQGTESQPLLYIRDPYVFEFLGLKSSEVMSESHLEKELTVKLQEFLLELPKKEEMERFIAEQLKAIGG